MLTTFDQVREWIIDNGLKRWMLFKDYSRKEKILDSNAFPSDLGDKIAMTEKYLRLAGGHAYAAGGTTAGANDMDVVTEIRLESEQPAAGVGGNFDAQTVGKLRDEITRSVRAEIEAERWKEREKEIARREKEFAEKEAGVWGVLVNKLGPAVLGKVLNTDRLVAGVDADAPVHTQPIVPTDDRPATGTTTGDIRDGYETIDTPEQPQEPTVWDEFTEEEAEHAMSMLARFKKVEPQYLELLESVVTMAENGDKMYTFAKSQLIKE